MRKEKKEYEKKEVRRANMTKFEGGQKLQKKMDIRMGHEVQKKGKTEDTSDYNKRYMVKPHCYCTLLFLPLSLVLNW